MIYHLGIRVIPFTRSTHLLKINKANKSAPRHQVALVGSSQVGSIATSARLNKAWKRLVHLVIDQMFGKKEKGGPVGVSSNEWTQRDFKGGQ